MAAKKLTTLEHLALLAERTQAELAERDERINELVNTGGEPNVLNGVKVNGTILAIASKMVDILIESGSTNGTISVNGANVAVKGLAALAYRSAVSESDLASALKTVINNKASQSDVTTLQNAITTLNGTGTGSVKKTVDDAIDAFAAKVSADGTINTLKELVDWVASHGEDAGDMVAGIEQNAEDIENLAKLIGSLPTGTTSTTIVAYIAEAIAALNIGDYAKISAMNSAIATALSSYYDKYQIDTKLSGYVTKDGDKVLSTNDYTTAEKTKLAGIASGATKVEASSTNGKIKINGVETTVYALPSDVLRGNWATDDEVTDVLNDAFGE